MLPRETKINKTKKDLGMGVGGGACLNPNLSSRHRGLPQFYTACPRPVGYTVKPCLTPIYQSRIWIDTSPWSVQISPGIGSLGTSTRAMQIITQGNVTDQVTAKKTEDCLGAEDKEKLGRQDEQLLQTGVTITTEASNSILRRLH